MKQKHASKNKKVNVVREVPPNVVGFPKGVAPVVEVVEGLKFYVFPKAPRVNWDAYFRQLRRGWEQLLKELPKEEDPTAYLVSKIWGKNVKERINKRVAALDFLFLLFFLDLHRLYA